jgi:hypothetical protein
MQGWHTRVFTNKVLFHHRQQGTAQFGRYTVEYSNGWKDYVFGSHPAWEMCRAVYRLSKKPFLLGGCLLFAGYFWAMLTETERIVSREVVAFRKKEQMNRLRSIFRRLFHVDRTGEMDAQDGSMDDGVEPVQERAGLLIPRKCADARKIA